MQNIESPDLEQRYATVWQEHMPKEVAWGTVLLALAVLAGYVLVIPAAIMGFVPYWLATLLCGYLAFASFTVGHDAGHGAIIRSGSALKPMEDVLGWMSTLPLLATSYRLFQKIHDRHHSFTNDPDRDPDYLQGDKGWLQLALGLGIIPFRYNWLAVTRFGKDKAMQDAYLPTVIFFVVAWGSLAALAIAGYGKEVLFFCLLPLLIANFLLITFFDYVPHHPHKSLDRFQASRIYPSNLLNILLFGQNYHLIHHLYPKLPWYKYKAVYEQIQPYLESKDSAIDRIDQGAALHSSPNGSQLPVQAKAMHWNLTVKTINRLTPDSVEVEFALPNGGSLAYQAGQYITVSKWLAGAYQTRCYSICASPEEKTLKIAVKQTRNGLMSKYLNQGLEPGDQLVVRGPFGDFTYPLQGLSEGTLNAGQHLVLVAAGSGITPIISILEFALSQDGQTSVTLIYANKDRQSTMYLKRLQMLQSSYNDRLIIEWVWRHPENHEPAKPSNIDKALLHKVLCQQAGQVKQHNTQVYICGPSRLKKTVVDNLSQLGIGQGAIHVEEFLTHGVAPVGELKRVRLSLLDGQKHTLRVASNQTVLQVAVQQGVDIPHACGNGLCGSCKCKLVSGYTADISAPGISQAELDSGYTLACQCRPVSDIELIECN